MVNKAVTINFLNKIIYFCICAYVALSCTEVLGAKYFMRGAVMLGVIRFIIKPFSLKLQTNHFWYIGAFFLAVISTIFLDGGNYYEGIKFLRLEYLGKMIPMVLILLFIKKEQIKNVLLCFMVSLCITNSYAIWEVFHGMSRVAGLAGGPMQLGGALLLLVPVTVLLVINKDFIPLRYRPFLLITLLLEIAAVFFNATRITWIVLLIVIPLLLLCMQKNKSKAIVYSLVFVILFIGSCNVIPQAKERLNVMFDQSYHNNSERILMWQSAGNMFRDHPLTGVGLGNYEEQYYGKYILPAANELTVVHAHNNIIHLAATTGFPGVVAYLAMFGYFLYESFKKWRHNKTMAPLIFFFATVGFFIEGMTDYNIGFGNLTVKIYWMLLAIYLVLDGAISVEDR